MPQTFDSFLESNLQLQHFRPKELLMRGASHSNRQSRAYGLNAEPPRELWNNILPTIRTLDILRTELGAPIRIISAYRTPAYNRAIGGAPRSHHTEFRAIDFTCDWGRPDKWVQELLEMRHSGEFTGGIGKYSTFIHIDTRGWNADW